MELSFLHNLSTSIGERRIELWRRSIYLFDQTKKEVGPFRKAGYKEFWCEGRSSEKLTPDIFGFSDDYFCVCDISMSPQKNEAMHKYSKCTPSQYIKERFPTEKDRKPSGSPFLITDLLGVVKYPGYNLVQVLQPGGATIDRIEDSQLKNILNNWHGFISPPPSYALSAVPESTPEELRAPMSGLFKWAAFQEGWVTIDSVVLNLLGDLFESISKSGRATLRKKVEEIVKDLSKGKLSDYLTYDPNNKRFRIRIERNSEQSRKSFTNKINEWSEIIPIERFFEDFDNEEEDE